MTFESLFISCVCDIFSHFVLYPDYRISFFIPLAFRFADYKKELVTPRKKISCNHSHSTLIERFNLLLEKYVLIEIGGFP